MFRCISYYLDAFGIVCCVTTLSSKQAKLVQKFVPRSRVGIFHSERTRSTPLYSKLMFLCISHYLDVFGTVWLPTKLGAKRAEVVPKFVPWSRFGIFHNKPLDPPHWTLNSCFGVFHTIWVHLVSFGYLTKTWCKTGWSGAKVRAMKSCRNFSQQTTRSTPLDPNLMFCCVTF